MKLALLVATPLLASAAAPSPFMIAIEAVEKISCSTGVGTGGRIDDNLIVSVAHVASASGCSTGGTPIEVAHIVPEKDFAVFRSPVAAPVRLTISCEPVKEGGYYFAVGYAFGGSLVVQRYVATDERFHGGTFEGMLAMKGKGFPGMSGGPVVDMDGSVIGVHAGTNKYVDIAAVRSLRDTYMCGGEDA